MSQAQDDSPTVSRFEIDGDRPPGAEQNIFCHIAARTALDRPWAFYSNDFGTVVGQHHAGERAWANPRDLDYFQSR